MKNFMKKAMNFAALTSFAFAFVLTIVPAKGSIGDKEIPTELE
jgi:hypothetical protein